MFYTGISSNLVALVVPTGDYEKERRILAEELTPRQFAELADLDYELARTAYAAYGRVVLDGTVSEENGNESEL